MAFGFLMLAAPLVVLSLPGTFGRYVERYRQQGQLRSFLRRTALVCAALGRAGRGGRRPGPALVLAPDLRPQTEETPLVALLAVRCWR